MQRFKLKQLGAVCIFVALHSSSVWGQLESPQEFPKVLQSLQPAGSMCRREVNLPAKTIDETIPEIADYSCLQSVSEMLPILRKSETLIFDLRPKAEFEMFHAQGAIHARESDIASKPYWKRSTVVLMGRGQNDGEVTLICDRLKRGGFERVMVLRGGVINWVKQNLPIHGEASSFPHLSMVSSSELWSGVKNGTFLALVDAGESEFSKDLKPSILAAPFTSEKLRNAVRMHRQNVSKNNPPLLGVVLVGSAEIRADNFDVLQSSVAPLPLFIYGQTHKDFVKDTKALTAIWRARDLGPKRPSCGG